MAQPRAVDVWYVCGQTLCNFDCAYCTTQPTRKAAGQRMWASDDSQRTFRAVLEWLAGLPWRIRIRLQTLGEPFVSHEFLSGAAWLSQQQNVDFVELVTNGSFRRKQFDRWASRCNISKISLWITYHHGQISPQSLVLNARTAQDAGAFVVVHTLAFPDNIVAIEGLVGMCREHEVRTDVTMGHNFNNAYPSLGLLATLETQPERLVSLYRHPDALRAMLAAHSRPAGQPCSAGHDYLRVYADGGVYPCAPYRGMPGKRLGSALDPGFVPTLRADTYAPCEARGLCECKEDHFHLQVAHSSLRFERSLGYYEVERGQVVHVGDAEMPIDLVLRRS